MANEAHSTLSLPLDPRRLCNACGAVNPATAESCADCGSERFAPPWVRALRRADSNFAVQVDDSHEKSESDEPVLSFYKWWLGGRANFKIRDQGQWERLKEIVDTDLAPILGWSSKEEALAELADRAHASDFDERSCAILERNPGLVVDLARALSRRAVDPEDLARLEDVCERLVTVVDHAESAYAATIRRFLENTPGAKEAGPRRLGALIEELLRSDARAARAELHRRVGLLELFVERIEDERSYKIVDYRTPIHRLLERWIWILDERYWFSDGIDALRSALDRAVVERDRPYAKKPPDFACGVLDDRLIVASIQPPAKELGIAELDQLERQVATCFEVRSFMAFEATLVGKTVSEDLRKALQLRDDSFKVKTYSELFDQRLRDYRRHLDLEPTASASFGDAALAGGS